jgi:hypothetical protein
VATEAAWLDGKKEKNHERSSLLLTGTGLLMEGVSGRLILVGQLWRFWGEIRDRRNSTIEDVRKTFELAKEKPNNPGLAGDFYRESSGTANAAEISKNRE